MHEQDEDLPEDELSHDGPDNDGEIEEKTAGGGTLGGEDDETEDGGGNDIEDDGDDDDEDGDEEDDDEDGDDEDDDEDDEDGEEGDEDELSLGAALGRLVGLLVDQPEDIHILEEVDVKGDTVFTVQVAPDDLGKLIGRQGRTARSLRNFLEVRGQLDGKSYSLEIREQP